MRNLRLRRLLRHAAQNSPYYRATFAAAGVRVEDVRDIDDLRLLPFTTPDDFSDTAPFLAVPPERVAHLFVTSGTSKKAKRISLTQADLDRCCNVLAALNRLGTWKTERPICMIFKDQGLWGGVKYVEGVVSRLGGLSLAVGIPPVGEAVALIDEFRPNMLATNPSYMAAVTRHAQSVGFRRRLKAITLGGELLTPSQADLFREYWGAEISNGYGLVEIGGVATGGNDCDALHFDLLHNAVEIVDPETGEPSDEGELVVTTLVNEAMPLVRYRTRDLCRRVDCRCGWSVPAFRVLSRLNDSVVVSGNNIHGRMLADALREIETKATSLEIIVEHAGGVDRLTLRVGIAPDSLLQAEDVQRELFKIYPLMGGEFRSGAYELAIDIVRTQELPPKFLRVRDLRR